MEKSLPNIPAKRYFTIGEVSELCGVKPYVLRYWEQEFAQLKPMKRRGNRRYYQHHEVLLIRRIRELLYDQGFTISGARNRLTDAGLARAEALEAAALTAAPDDWLDDVVAGPGRRSGAALEATVAHLRAQPSADRTEVRIDAAPGLDLRELRAELVSIRDLLTA